MMAAQQAEPEDTRPSFTEQNLPKIQKGLAQAQDIATLAKAVASLVHDVNQPLTAIGNYATGCRHLLHLGHHQEIDAALQQISDQANRAFHIAQEIRQLVGTLDPESEP